MNDLQLHLHAARQSFPGDIFDGVPAQTVLVAPVLDSLEESPLQWDGQFSSEEQLQ